MKQYLFAIDKQFKTIGVFLGGKDIENIHWFWGVNDTILEVFIAHIHKDFVKGIKQLHPQIQQDWIEKTPITILFSHIFSIEFNCKNRM